MGTLRRRAAWVTSYHAFQRSKSTGNYLGMLTGQFTRCEADDGSPGACGQHVDSIYAQLARSGRSWNEFDEAADVPCDTSDHGPYVAHHVPAAYLAGMCAGGDLPMGPGAYDTSALDARLAQGDVGTLTVLVPNNCENGHDVCGVNPVHAFDRFLAREVPKIERSPAFGSNGTLIVTWDEGDFNDHVLLLATGGLVRPGTYHGARYTHYSLLGTLETGFRAPLLRGARGARTLPIWR